jgi:hypothetical protein
VLKRGDLAATFRLTLVFLFVVPSIALAQEWQQSVKTNTLTGVSYPQFILDGKWLTPPQHGVETPSLVVHCQPGRYVRGRANGKFIDGYFVTGAVLDSRIGDVGFGLQIAGVDVQFRLDDKNIQPVFWGRSTDFSGVFFTSADLNNLLYGHLLPHKEGTSDAVHKVVIAVNEYLAAQIVAQFDMPDPTRVAEACGAILHK